MTGNPGRAQAKKTRAARVIIIIIIILINTKQPIFRSQLGDTSQARETSIQLKLHASVDWYL